MSAPQAIPGGVRLLLRAEGLAALVVSCLIYGSDGYSWGLFALCFLLPDLSFIGALAGTRSGVAAYNAAHSYVGPLALAVVCHLAGADAVTRFSLIWIAHIGFDRALGYGLKYPSGFSDTHLGRVGRRT